VIKTSLAGNEDRIAKPISQLNPSGLIAGSINVQS